MDNTLVGIAVLSAQRVILKVNGHFGAMLGFDDAELIGKSGLAFVENSEQSVHLFLDKEKELRDKGSCRVRARLRRKDGSLLWCLLSGKLLEGPREDAYSLWMCADIDALVHSRQELARTKGLLQNIFDSIPGMLIVIDTEYNIVKLSRQYRESMRLSSGAEGDKCHQAVKNVAEVCPECVAGRAMDTGEVHTRFSTPYEEKLTGKAFKMFTAPLRNDRGTVIGAIEHFIDITDLRRTQEQLLAARVQAEEATRAKSLLLANMSHEVRNPLNGIGGMIDLALAGRQEPRERAHLELAREACTKLSRLLDDIMDLSKLESDSFCLNKESFALRPFAQGLMALHAAQAEPKRLALVLQIDPGVPECVVTDPTRLSQILSNLLSNAIKFSDRGEVRLNVSLAEVRHEQKLLFEVQDTGIGIPAESLDRIFHSFTQLDQSARSHFQGAGLGLPISRMLARRLGGDIDVESAPGKGSVFRFHIDFEGGHCRMSSPAKAPEDETLPDVGGLRALVVEDDPLNRYYMERVLTEAQVRPTVAETAGQALSLLAGQSFDVALMDIQLPDMDGLDLVGRLRREASMETNRRIPVIAVTGYSDSEQVREFLDAGMDDVILKPFTARELLETIARHTRAPRLRDRPDPA